MKRIVLAVALLLIATPAVAQDKEGERLSRAGIARFMHKDWEAARADFAQAYAADPVPKYLWNLALAELNGNHPAEALAHFKQFLALPTATDEDRRKAQKPMAEAEAKLPPELPPAPPPAPPLPPPSLSSSVGTPPPRSPPPAPPSLVPAQPSNARWVAAATVGAVGVTSLVISGVYFANASGQSALIDAPTSVCPQPPTTPGCIAVHDAANAKAQDENVGRGFAIAGGALLLGAVATAILWPPRHPQVGIAALPGGGAALWSGSF